MPNKHFVIDKRLGVVMGTTSQARAADEPHGGPAPWAGGTDIARGAGFPQIREARSSAISNFVRKNGVVSPSGDSGGSEGSGVPVRHLLAGGGAACGSGGQHLTAYRELVTCRVCLERVG